MDAADETRSADPGDPADPIARRTHRLGESVRAARLRAGLSQRELAARLSLSSGMISQLEKGLTQPSVTTLLALSDTLDVSLDSLFNIDDETGPVPPAEVLSSQLTWLEAARSDGPGEARSLSPRLAPMHTAPGQRAVAQMAGGVTWELLTADQQHPVLFMIVTYPPGSSTNPEGDYVRHADHEYFYLLEGELEVNVEFEHRVVRPGEAMWFDSTRPHRFVNSGDVAARGVWFLLPQP